MNYVDDTSRDRELAEYHGEVALAHKSEVTIQFDSVEEIWSFLHFVVDRIRDEKTEFFVNIGRMHSSDAIGNALAFEKLIDMQNQIVEVIQTFEADNGKIPWGMPLLYPKTDKET